MTVDPTEVNELRYTTYTTTEYHRNIPVIKNKVDGNSTPVQWNVILYIYRAHST